MKFKAIAVLASALLLAGCSTPAPEPSDDGKLHIVASTNVWADLVETIGGEYVSVTAIVTNPNQDPHSYELTPKDKLAISKADFVVAACNATDSFIQPQANNYICLGENSVTDPTLNPHIWYNLRLMAGYAIPTLAGNLAFHDPAHADYYQANQHTFEQQAATILDSGQQLLSNYQLRVAQEFVATESVADELLVELGFTNVTPKDVIQAGMNETDLSPKQMADLQQQLVGRLFVYNKSQISAQTDSILAFLKDSTCADGAACAAKAKPVGFFEQLPAGMNYLSWMDRNIKDVVSTATDTVIN